MYIGLEQLKKIKDRWWEPAFSLLKCEVINKQREKTKVIHVVMDSAGDLSVRPMFSLI